MVQKERMHLHISPASWRRCTYKDHRSKPVVLPMSMSCDRNESGENSGFGRSTYARSAGDVAGIKVSGGRDFAVPANGNLPVLARNETSRNSCGESESRKRSQNELYSEHDGKALRWEGRLERVTLLEEWMESLKNQCSVGACFIGSRS
jgi:hypothetical protein